MTTLDKAPNITGSTPNFSASKYIRMPAQDSPSLQHCAWTPDSLHSGDVGLNTLARQTHLLGREITAQSDSLQSISGLAAMALCMIQTYADPKALRGIEPCEALLVAALLDDLVEVERRLGLLHLEARREGGRDDAARGPSLWGEASDFEHASTDNHRSFEDDFEKLYDEPLRQNADICGDSAPSPCAEAWMKLTSLLQMRSSYLEHQVRELQDMNDSLADDVHWHVEALGDMEEQLREAQFERAAALAEVLDLKVQVACSVKRDIDHSITDEEASYTALTDSKPTTPSLNYNGDTVLQPNNATLNDTYTHTPALKPSPPAANARHIPISGFYFHPTSMITLPTTPPQSFQWQPGTTLHEIRTNLISRHERGIEDNPRLAAILQVMDQRQIMGIQLPRATRDGVIWIDVPDVPDVYSVPFMNHGVDMGAWGSFDRDWVVDGPGFDEVWDGSCDGHAAGDVNIAVRFLQEGKSSGFDGSCPADQIPRQFHDNTRYAFLESAGCATDSSRVGFLAEQVNNLPKRHVVEKPFPVSEICARCVMPDWDYID